MGIEEHENCINFHDALMSSNGKSGYNVSFDDMLAEHNQAHAKRRTMLSVADLDEEEHEYDYFTEESENIGDKESNIQLKSQI